MSGNLHIRFRTVFKFYRYNQNSYNLHYIFIQIFYDKFLWKMLKYLSVTKGISCKIYFSIFLLNPFLVSIYNNFSCICAPNLEFIFYRHTNERWSLFGDFQLTFGCSIRCLHSISLAIKMRAWITMLLQTYLYIVYDRYSWKQRGKGGYLDSVARQ